MFKEHKNKIITGFVILCVLDFVIFSRIFVLRAESKDLKIYFLDVGQGDSELVILPGGIKMIIDGGLPNGKLLENLGSILPIGDRYIDLVMVSHPQLDHFGGLIEVMKRYQIGAFLWNGRDGTASAWQELKKVIEQNKIKNIVLAASDKIHYQDSNFNILSPNPEFLRSKELNYTTLVTELVSDNSKTLFTGDIGFNVEETLLNYHVDILKVPHHGSKFSSGDNFLSAIKPKIAVIEVGKNSYGHPTKEAMTRLQDSGAKIYRTDQNGTIELLISNQKIRVFIGKKSSK